MAIVIPFSKATPQALVGSGQISPPPSPGFAMMAAAQISADKQKANANGKATD